MLEYKCRPRNIEEKNTVLSMANKFSRNRIITGNRNVYVHVHLHVYVHVHLHVYVHVHAYTYKMDMLHIHTITYIIYVHIFRKTSKFVLSLPVRDLFLKCIL